MQGSALSTRQTPGVRETLRPHHTAAWGPEHTSDRGQSFVPCVTARRCTCRSRRTHSAVDRRFVFAPRLGVQRERQAVLDRAGDGGHMLTAAERGADMSAEDRADNRADGAEPSAPSPVPSAPSSVPMPTPDLSYEPLYSPTYRPTWEFPLRTQLPSYAPCAQSDEPMAAPSLAAPAIRTARRRCRAARAISRRRVEL